MGKGFCYSRFLPCRLYYLSDLVHQFHPVIESYKLNFCLKWSPSHLAEVSSTVALKVPFDMIILRFMLLLKCEGLKGAIPYRPTVCHINPDIDCCTAKGNQAWL